MEHHLLPSQSKASNVYSQLAFKQVSLQPQKEPRTCLEEAVLRQSDKGDRNGGYEAAGDGNE